MCYVPKGTPLPLIRGFRKGIPWLVVVVLPLIVLFSPLKNPSFAQLLRQAQIFRGVKIYRNYLWLSSALYFVHAKLTCQERGPVIRSKFEISSSKAFPIAISNASSAARGSQLPVWPPDSPPEYTWLIVCSPVPLEMYSPD